MTRILVVEDNDNMRRGLCDLLEADNFEVIAAADGKQALSCVQAMRPDLIILDLMIPELDGAHVLRALRASGGGPPVLVLTAKSDEDEKVRLLRMGADDYVTKPFGRRELSARIGAILRRAEAGKGDHTRSTLRVGDVAIDLRSRIVSREGRTIALSPKEYDLLVALAHRAGDVVTRADLLRDVWRYEPDVVSRTVDLHVLELRRRLERDPARPELILTVRKVGYRMCAPATAPPPHVFGSG
jgi:two-component system, OmpR family, response regulator MtrA